MIAPQPRTANGFQKTIIVPDRSLTYSRGRVRIPAAPDVEERRLRDLSGDIALKPGDLRIEFYGAEDLAAKLLELSKAMANDWRAFARAVEDGGKEASASA